MTRLQLPVLIVATQYRVDAGGMGWRSPSRCFFRAKSARALPWRQAAATARTLWFYATLDYRRPSLGNRKFVRNQSQRPRMRRVSAAPVSGEIR